MWILVATALAIIYQVCEVFLNNAIRSSSAMETGRYITTISLENLVKE